MNRKTILGPGLLVLVALIAVAAQSPRRGTSRRPAPKPSPAQPATTQVATPSPQPVMTEPSSPVLAVLGTGNITAADIEPDVSRLILNDPDPYLRAFYQDRAQAIKEARQRAVDVRVNSMLITAEAAKRKLSRDDFLDKEVNGKIPAPTDAEVRAVYDANRAQLGNDIEAVRANIVNYIRSQRAEGEYNQLINRLKMTNTVMKHAEVNAPNLAPGAVLVAVNGTPLRVDTINERMKAYVYKMDRQIYETQKQVLDRRINDLLIVAEAEKRKVGSEQIVRAEVTDKLKPPTEAEISKFYEENKARLGRDLASLHDDIATYLQAQQEEKLEADLAQRLRAGARVQMLLKEPVAPVFNVTTGKGPSRGDANSPVKVVEFTDFQCSACGGMYPVLESVLKSYGNRVYFEVRNFPLTNIHANAFKAAQAAAAAHAQGKFWEYIDLLFTHQSSLDDASLKKYATQVGLDRRRFDAELDSGKFEADVRRDMEEGELFGIEGTPTIFVNGKMLTVFSADGLREAIEKAGGGKGL